MGLYQELQIRGVPCAKWEHSEPFLANLQSGTLQAVLRDHSWIKMHSQGRSVNTGLICMGRDTAISSDRKKPVGHNSSSDSYLSALKSGHRTIRNITKLCCWENNEYSLLILHLPFKISL